MASAGQGLDRVTALLALVSRHSSKSFHALLSSSSFLPASGTPFWCCGAVDSCSPIRSALPESSGFGRLLLDYDFRHPPIDCLPGPPSPCLSLPSLLIIHRFRIKWG